MYLMSCESKMKYFMYVCMYVFVKVYKVKYQHYYILLCEYVSYRYKRGKDK